MTIELQTEEVPKLDTPATNEETTAEQVSNEQVQTAAMEAQKQAQMAAMQPPSNKKVSTTPPAPQQTQVNLLEVNITNENTALNVMVGFLSVAQKRGCYSLPESAKIFECVELFRQNVAASSK